MGAGHTHALYVHEHSSLHALAPEVKIVATVVMVTAVAVTPRESVPAFLAYAVVVAALVTAARVPAGFMAARLLTVAPFVAFALLLPFVASGETTTVLGVEVSIAGLWASWNVLAKATLGASITILLTATTEIPEILRGMGAIRVPTVFTSIAIFMIRYLELVAGELSRMRVAMTSRGYDPRWLHQAGPMGHAAGSLFVRSYERGERIHAAMLSRGFTGAMPATQRPDPTWRQWATAAAPISLFLFIAVVALLSR